MTRATSHVPRQVPLARSSSLAWLVALAAAWIAASGGCSKGVEPPPADAPAPDVGPAGWAPGTILAPIAEGPRGLRNLRGNIHAHSVHSHDACDGQPRDDAGALNTVCLDDFRKALCASRHDFVMLTDHPALFADTEFPEALLYRAERGDRLITRGGAPVANWAGCEGGRKPVLLLAGTEGGTMPVGLEGHVSPDRAERGRVYGDKTAEAVLAQKAKGAVSLLQHTENWTADQLATLPIDGFEMYNVHANLMRNPDIAIEMIFRLGGGRDDLPHPDLFILPIVREDPRYLDTWGSVLARGVRRVTVMGSDYHRNTFPALLSDGERIDSYRRMMGWFSNHLLIRPAADGSYTDVELKEALRSGRLWGAYEYLGYPVGFDFHALEAGTTREMGDEATLAKGAVELVATMPSLAELDPTVPAPRLTLRLLRAREGGWDTVKDATESMRVNVDAPGAYRVEVRLVPRHLQRYLGRDAEKLANEERVWIYSNPIYVRP